MHSFYYQTYETVRFVRVDLPNGDTELLIASLLDPKKHQTKIFKNLYFQRWGAAL